MRASRGMIGLVSSVLLAGTLDVGLGAGRECGRKPQATGQASTTRVIRGSQTTRLERGTAGGGEIAPSSGEEAASAQIPVANRSLSSQAKAVRGGPGLLGIVAPNTAVVASPAAVSFEAINHHQQRLEVAGGNQWSIEPPDQALCVGGGYIFEAVNNAVAVYDTTGTRIALDSLNNFFGYPVEIDRTAGTAGPKQTTGSHLPVRPDDEPVLRDDPHL